MYTLAHVNLNIWQRLTLAHICTLQIQLFRCYKSFTQAGPIMSPLNLSAFKNFSIAWCPCVFPATGPFVVCGLKLRRHVTSVEHYHINLAMRHPSIRQANGLICWAEFLLPRDDLRVLVSGIIAAVMVTETQSVILHGIQDGYVWDDWALCLDSSWVMCECGGRGELQGSGQVNRFALTTPVTETIAVNIFHYGMKK